MDADLSSLTRRLNFLTDLAIGIAANVYSLWIFLVCYVLFDWSKWISFLISVLFYGVWNWAIQRYRKKQTPS
jgi:CHASE2 domain-containing sensor protein